jgi:hypothetical protein
MENFPWTRLAGVVSRASANISTTGILPAITNGRTKEYLPSGELVSKKREHYRE